MLSAQGNQFSIFMAWVFVYGGLMAPLLRPAGLLPAGFHGEREVEGPLTFAQHDTIAWIDDPNDAGSALLNWTFVLPDADVDADGDVVEVGLEDVAAAFGVLMARHESLRTTFVGGAEPCQRVAAHGELAIQLYEIPPDLDRESAAQLLVGELRAQGVDHAAGLPLRVGVACVDSRPRAVVAVYSHLAVDFASIAILGGQFTALLADPASRQPGPRGHQPIDQALLETSTRGRRRSDAAIEYWRSRLTRAPQATYTLPVPEFDAQSPGQQRERMTCLLRSPAGAEALRRIAARTQVGARTIVMAASCAVVACRTDVNRLVFASLSHNRFRLNLTDYVGNLAQDALVVLDVDADDTFDALVARAAQATMTANAHGSYDPRALEAVHDEVGFERGTVFARDFVVNDLSAHLSPSADEEPVSQTTVVWMPAGAIPEVLLSVTARVDGEFIHTFTADPARITELESESLARGVERLLLAAAERDVSIGELPQVCGIEPVRRGPDWALVDSCWIELSSVRALVLDATGAPAVGVFVEDGVLSAYVSDVAEIAEPAAATASADTEVRTPHAAHLACMRLLPERCNAMAPGRYVFVHGVPDDPDDAGYWRKLEVCGEGDGRRP